MLVDVNIQGDLKDVADNMSTMKKWDLLQYLWDELEKKGTDADWASFYDDNGLIKKQAQIQEESMES